MNIRVLDISTLIIRINMDIESYRVNIIISDIDQFLTLWKLTIFNNKIYYMCPRETYNIISLKILKLHNITINREVGNLVDLQILNNTRIGYPTPSSFPAKGCKEVLDIILNMNKIVDVKYGYFKCNYLITKDYYLSSFFPDYYLYEFIKKPN